MPDFTTGLTARLLAAAPVTALAGTRLHWGTVPQGTPRPYVRLNVISDPRPRTLDGPQDARTSRVQADCFADRYEIARALAQAVITATAQPGTAGGIRFNGAEAQGPADRGGDVEGVGFIHLAAVDLIFEHTQI